MSPSIFEQPLRCDWTASVLILSPERRVLLLYHDKLRVWLGPGGHVEPGESPEDTAHREVSEETGLEIELLGARDATLDDVGADVRCLRQPYVMLRERITEASGSHYHLDLIYCAKLAAGTSPQPRPGAGAHGARFFGEDELEALDMFANFRALLRRVFADDDLWRELGAPPARQQAGRGPLVRRRREHRS